MRLVPILLFRFPFSEGVTTHFDRFWSAQSHDFNRLCAEVRRLMGMRHVSDETAVPQFEHVWFISCLHPLGSAL
jgi:hypothetical protein